ncbi:MAG: hrpA, partial [Gammaproteobacteria bacterium]|nr:hrpA [Gammaproteobacteria bacterium]
MNNIEFPQSLPITQKIEEIASLLKLHQVLIVAGETGSGKSTQLPKICLSLGLACEGKIGHTQPRRLAARNVAARVAEELQCELGSLVGYQVRFHDQFNEETKIKLMTDGILLAEIQQDRLLKQYDVLIIDEAHERSLNIDFLLGYLKQLIAKRPNLKVIITSATIDHIKFSKHF